jgi:hypothetical protein
MKSSVYGAGAAAYAVAAALSISVAGPHRAYASPSPYAMAQSGDISVSLLSPAPHTSFTGAKPVEIDAFYQSNETNQITEVDLYIDGVKAAAKALTTPESRGVISFLIDASALSPGGHNIVVRATAADAEVVSVKGSFVYVEALNTVPDAGLPTEGGDASGAPDLSITSPISDSRVEGTVRISVSAHDPNGGNPYVSYFVDRQFKTLRNYPPYDFIWDTTNLPNGLHTVEIYAYNDAQNVGPAKILRLYVNNPGGFTGIRTDLKDGISPMPAKIAAPILRHKTQKAVARIVAKPKTIAPLLPAAAVKPKTIAPLVPVAAVKPKTIAPVLPVLTANPKTIAPVLPVVAARHIKPVLAPPTLAITRTSIKAAQTLPIIDQSEAVSMAGQIGAVTQPKVTTPVSAAPAPQKTILAPARLSHVNITLDNSGDSTEIAQSNNTIGSSFEPALSSPFKTAKPIAAAKATPKTTLAPPVLAQATPQTSISPKAIKPSMEIASIHIPQDTLSSPFLIAPHVAPAIVKPTTIKPVMVHKTVAPVAVKPVVTHTTIAPVTVKPVVTHPVIAPVTVKPVVSHPVIAPVAVKPVVSHPVIAPVVVKPVVAHHAVAPAELKPVILHTTINHIAAKPVVAHRNIAPITLRPVISQIDLKPVALKPVILHLNVKPSSLRPMFMVSIPDSELNAMFPAIHSTKSVKASGPIEVQATEIRHIRVHIAATPQLINMLRCKGEMAVIIGDRVVHLDRPLTTKGSMLFGPLRQIFEFEGGELTWESSTQTVTGHSPARDITLQIGSRTAQINEKEVSLPGTPYLQRGRTMVPMQILPDVLNANMKYDPTNGHILITSKN